MNKTINGGPADFHEPSEDAKLHKKARERRVT